MTTPSLSELKELALKATQEAAVDPINGFTISRCVEASPATVLAMIQLIEECRGALEWYVRLVGKDSLAGKTLQSIKNFGRKG